MPLGADSWLALEEWVASQHPRDRLGRWRDVSGATVDDLFRASNVKYAPGEAQALRDYSGDLSRQINRDLHSERARALRHLVDRSPLPGRIHAVRQVAPHELEGVKVGDMITPNRFTSASVGTTWGYTSHYGELHISMPKGAHAAYQAISYGVEDELILPPGARLRVRRVTHRDGRPLVYAEYVSELHEAFAEHLHPRDRRGRFRSVPSLVGVTPFRGAGRARGADYYSTTRWKGFVNAVPRIAERDGVHLGGLEPARGVWAGGGEPSAQVLITGRQRSIVHFMDDVAARYDQDAAIGFRGRKGGHSVRYVSAQHVEAATAERALKNTAIPGATITADGHLELIDTDDSLFGQVASLAEDLGIDFKTEKGYGFLRFAGQRYTKRSQRRRAS